MALALSSFEARNQVGFGSLLHEATVFSSEG
jgi:hypothetical protein